MAQEQQVELDTDNYEEQEVQVKENVKTETDDAKLETVDLGYTEHNEAKEEKAVVKEEPKEDNLQEHSDTVQKRINQLTRKMREAERREKAALDYAKGLQAKYQKVESTLHQTDDAYVKEYENRVDVETDKVKTQLRNAMEANDYDKMMDANQNLTRLAVEKEKAKYKKEELESIKNQEEEEKQQQQQPVAPQPSPRAQEWASTNSWFGQDKAMTNAAFGIHEDLIQKGFDAESEEYYAEVDKQMRDYFPNKFVKERPVQTVASAGRKQQGRRTVKLTRSQVAIAKSLGVPIEEYAKYVKEQ